MGFSVAIAFLHVTILLSDTNKNIRMRKVEVFVLKILKKIHILMDQKQKSAMVRLFVMMMISAGLETGAVMMVMAVVQIGRAHV